MDDPAARAKLDNRLGAEYATFYPADGPAKAVPISWRVERFQGVVQRQPRWGSDHHAYLMYATF